MSDPAKYALAEALRVFGFGLMCLASCAFIWKAYVFVSENVVPTMAEIRDFLSWLPWWVLASVVFVAGWIVFNSVAERIWPVEKPRPAAVSKMVGL